MKAKALVVLALAGVWGLGCWWWYACDIKGFCGAAIAHTEQASDTHSTKAATKTPEVHTDTKAADTPTPAATALATASTAAALTPPETKTEEKQEEKPVAATAKPTEPTPEVKEEVPAEPPVSNEPVVTTADDSDKDGVPNELEQKLGLDPYMADSDKDGVSDKDELGEKPAEAPLDTDDDGTINALDTDDDGDGDLTSNEAVDANRDGSVTDARDSDQDGTPDYLDKDSGWATLDDDNDGILNGEEKEAGTNPTLTDSDGDGVADSVELADKKDTDQDGTLDALDTDDDNDGVMTAMENPDPNNDGNLADAADHNKNGVADYLEANSSGETVAQNNTRAEPNPKDPDMATGQVAASTATESIATKESEADAAETEANAEEEKASEAQPEEAEAQQKAVASKTSDANKITVDMDKPAAGKKNVSSARLYFPFRSTKPELADSTADYFDDLISYLKANPKAKVQLIGHTDNVGDADINKKLGLQRAERIRTVLVKRGAPADRVEASSKGEATPWVSNKTEEGRNKNRRVEVKPIK
ncbi:MAG: OmpA family protein [Thiolinea sp.]